MDALVEFLQQSGCSEVELFHAQLAVEDRLARWVQEADPVAVRALRANLDAGSVFLYLDGEQIG